MCFWNFYWLAKSIWYNYHNILLEKIQHYGIREITHQWFKSYLENRKQIVSMNGAESELGSENYGFCLRTTTIFNLY